MLKRIFLIITGKLDPVSYQTGYEDGFADGYDAGEHALNVQLFHREREAEDSDA